MISADRQLTDMVSALVECATGRRKTDLFGTTRGEAPVARARQLAMYLSHTTLSMSLARVGAAFGRDKSTVGHAVQQIEDLRDDADFDEWLSGLETAVGSLATTASRRSSVLSGVWRRPQEVAGMASASA